MTGPALVVFAGLPGTGKTLLARAVADRLGATFLRIDTIEAALTRGGLPMSGNPAAYVAGRSIAADQLRAGRPVVVDAVNPVAEARQGWVELASTMESELRLVEVVCSDPAEHRRRVDGRVADPAGSTRHGAPAWPDVVERHYEPWADPRLVIDNLGDPEPHIVSVLRYVSDASLRG